MNLETAKLCDDCQEIFEGDTCPTCGCTGHYLKNWINVLKPGIKVVKSGIRSVLPKVREIKFKEGIAA